MENQRILPKLVIDTKEENIQQNPSAMNLLIRVRPVIQQDHGDYNCIQKLTEKSIILRQTTGIQQIDQYSVEQQFTFDKILNEQTSQETVFKNSQHIFNYFLSGYHASLLLYGITSSGKSYTLFENDGLVRRGIQYILQNNTTRQYFCSYIQIYNEQIQDLLDIQNNQVKIQMLDKNESKIINQTIVPINNMNDLEEILTQGQQNKIVASTAFNTSSSRSHVILIISYIQEREAQTPQSINFTEKVRNFQQVRYDQTLPFVNLYLTDLAGSEKLTTNIKSVQGQETKFINTSLYALTKLIYKLSENKSTNYLPFRDSVLTKLLAPALSGRFTNLIIICISPVNKFYVETINSLRFGERAKEIQKEVMKADDNGDKQKLKIIEQLNERIMELQQQLLQLSQTQSSQLNQSQSNTLKSRLIQEKKRKEIQLQQENNQDIKEEINKILYFQQTTFDNICQEILEKQNQIIVQKLIQKHKQYNPLKQQINEQEIQLKEMIEQNNQQRQQLNYLLDYERQIDLLSYDKQQIQMLIEKQQLQNTDGDMIKTCQQFCKEQDLLIQVISDKLIKVIQQHVSNEIKHFRTDINFTLNIEQKQIQRQINDFPYDYTPINPQLHQKQKRNLFMYLLQIMFICISPIVIPLRVILAIIAMLINSINCMLINICNSNIEKPLSKLKSKFFDFSVKTYCGIALLATGHVIIKKDKRRNKQKCNFIVVNHSSLFDILINGYLGCQCIISNKSVATNIFTKSILLASKSLIVGGKNNSNDVYQQMVDRYGTETNTESTTSDQQVTQQLQQTKDKYNWPPLTLYPEGATTNNDCIIRFKTGCFRLLQPVQPIVFKYNSFYKSEWLYENPVTHIFYSILNPITIVKVQYLDPMIPQINETPRKFADRVGKTMAESINVQYLPYTKNDSNYFRENKPIESCTAYYLKDYQWMGRINDYKKLCKKAKKLTPRYEYSKQELVKDE